MPVPTQYQPASGASSPTSSRKAWTAALPASESLAVRPPNRALGSTAKAIHTPSISICPGSCATAGCDRLSVATMAPAPTTMAAVTGNLKTPRIKPPCVLIVPPSPPPSAPGPPAGEVFGAVRVSVSIVYRNLRECTEGPGPGHVTVTPAFRHDALRRLALLHPGLQRRHHVEFM